MRLTTVVLSCAFVVLPATSLQAQRGGGPPPPPRPVRFLSALQLRELDAHIEQVRQQWEVPGLAVGIVQGDSVMLLKGYGVKELGKPARVDENTLFAIGSSGKSMTAAVVSMLVDDGKMKLDDPVWTYLPRFRVADPYVTREATIRDLLAHRTDLQNATSPWYGAALTRAEVIDRLRFLKQEYSFRSRFSYNNLMLMVAGEAAAAAAGKSWEELLRERLFTPLGMTSSLTNPQELTAQSNVATPHMPLNGKLAPIPHRDTRNIAPAGAQYSSARDMAQYLRLQLGNGAYRGKRLISESSMTQMRSVAISNGTPVIITDSTTTGLGYGLGWFTEYYRGHRLLRHGGAIDGMLTEMMFLPEDQIGVVVLTNRSPHTMHTALTNHIFDVALGLPQRDWNARAFARARTQETQAAERLKTMQSQRVQNAPPSLPLDKYAGTYSDSLGGDVRISVENGTLMLRYHPGFIARLEHWQYNTFRVDWQNASVLISPAAFATFNLDQNGKPIELEVSTLGTFRSAAPAARPARAATDYSAPADAPYTAEQVTVPTPMEHALAGTLTLPRGASRARPVPAIVTITGSGGQDRDEYIGMEGYRPFRQFADSLSRRGIAVLRMDDRGTGASTGQHKGATSADFAEDIRAGLAYLRTRPEIDASRLGLMGHSEGGLIAPLVALKEPTLKAIVLLAGPSKSGQTILQFQLANLINNNKSLSAAARDSALAHIPMRIDSLKAADPWMAFFLNYDPMVTVRQVRTPVLILTGGTDQQVTPDQVAELEAAFKAAGNRDVTARVLPNLNHLFIYDTSGFPGDYAKLPRPRVETEVVGMVADWLVQRLRN